VKQSKSIRKTRTSFLAFTAAALAVIPLFASAGAGQDTDRVASTLFDSSDRVVSTSESLYARIKSESRKICGDSSIYLTGSVRRSAGIEECYEGTLTAAVERLGDPRVSALHRKESGEL
jgi:UrcA family protein